MVLTLHSYRIYSLLKVEPAHYVLNSSVLNHIQLMVRASAPHRVIDFLEVQTLFLFVIKDLDRSIMHNISGYVFNRICS